MTQTGARPQSRQPLPIDPLVPEIVGRLTPGSCVVVEAPPGAGKTTRVPPALLAQVEREAPGGEVWVLEPRRLAAHLSAARVAEERGEALGEVVGVQMRFDSVCGPRTRLRYVTEGVLTRRLLHDPGLGGVAAVVLDEFHERHLQGDLALALLMALQAPSGRRPDLRLCVMSATLDAGAVAQHLGGCPVVRSEGRSHEVSISHLQQPPDRPVAKEVRSAIFRVLQEDAAVPAGGADRGDILVFLPGAAEIRQTAAELAELAAQRGLDVLPLHGDLPLSEQRRAVEQRTAGRRKIILATNVAETSVTIDGVTVVVDSGLARLAGHSPWSGLPTLRVQRVARAAATQRAGRAGRTRAGRCLRLYTLHDFETRPAYETPEVRRLDLAETVLLLRASGLDPAALRWLDPPPAAALAAAGELLSRLGALDGAEVTALGRQMAGLPLHPRQARVLLAAAERGVGQDGCTVAALLGERDLLLRQRAGGLSGRGWAQESGPSDVLMLLEVFAEARRQRFVPERLAAQGIDGPAAQAVERVRRRLAQALPTARDHVDTRDHERALLQALLMGYPDRVARRRERGGKAGPGGGTELVLAGGGSAVLGEGSVVRDAELVVAIDAEERSAGAGAGGRPGAARTLVQRASAIEADWLLDLPGEALAETAEAQWNAAAERVEIVQRLKYEGLVLTESRTVPSGQAGADPAHEAVLWAAARAAGLSAFVGSAGEELGRLRERLAFLAAHCPAEGARAVGDAELEAVLRELCAGRTSFAAVREAAADVERLVLAHAGVTRQRLAALAPEHLSLPGGRRVRVEYLGGQQPWIAARLQDFFGLRQGPAVGAGRVQLVLHLLAPSGKPVQVTADLSGFWARHYPAIRRELCRRYPRHSWPEDPLAASPPPPGRPR